MSTEASVARCLTFINCQLAPSSQHVAFSREERQMPAVTISRQAGSGSHIVAEKLAGLLEARLPNESCRWTVFDRNLVEKVLDDHHLPTRLAKFMPEDRISEVSDTMDELFGLHPPSWTLVRETSDTIFRLAQMGSVILIGRGATIITRKLNHVFHVRLVGSVERRLEHIQEYYKLSPKAAVKMLQEEDRGRRRYVKKYFGKDIDDPLLYHVVINTDHIPYDLAARIIADAIVQQHPAPA